MSNPKARLPGGAGSLGGVRDVDTSAILRVLSNLIKVGKVTENDAEKGTYSIDFGGNQPVKLRQRVGRAGDDVEDDMHTKDEQVVVLNAFGDLARGIIIGSIHKEGQKLFKKDTQKGRKYKDGTLIKQDVEKKTRSTAMPKDGTHDVSVDKQRQTVDPKGTRLANDRGVVDLDTSGTIRKVNSGGGVVVNSGGNVYINC